MNSPAKIMGKSYARKRYAILEELSVRLGTTSNS
jgi:hypothetical protein